MKFTFTATKAEKIHGETGFNVVIKRDGQAVAEVWSAGNKREALADAREHAENYGYIDGVN